MTGDTTNTNTNGATEIEIAQIVACAENGVIGVDGDLPWSLPDDLKHFMRSTKGHAIIMGRKTFESLPKALDGRTNIVVSRSMEKDEVDENVMVARSLDEAIAMGLHETKRLGRSTLWVAGGGEIYRETLEWTYRVVRTRVHAEVEGDTRYPDLDPDGWVLESSEGHEPDDRHAVGFTIESWRRV